MKGFQFLSGNDLTLDEAGSLLRRDALDSALRLPLHEPGTNGRQVGAGDRPVGDFLQRGAIWFRCLAQTALNARPLGRLPFRPRTGHKSDRSPAPATPASIRQPTSELDSHRLRSDH